MFFLKKLYYEKYSKKSYSLSNVDLIIDYILKDIKQGVYIDLGCNHPIKYNNTYLLHKRGWSGINIDCDETSIKLFTKYRKNDFNVKKIVSGDEEIKKLYIYHDRSTINTLEKTLVDSRTSKPKKVTEERSTTLNQIIESSPFKDSKINLLSVDIEGHEFHALKNFDFLKYKIDLIVIEFFDKKIGEMEIYKQSVDFITNSNIYNLLLKNGYKLVNWIHSDLIFIRNDFYNNNKEKI
tara:strand:+ start:2582 stop:3292 length:711 start_codon:yes stop_codon:yes gene_type:complete